MALVSAFISGTSTIEVSSTTSRSQSSGFSSLREKPPCFGINLQQAVDGLGLQPGLLGHALGRASCGRGQRHPDALGDQQAQDRVEQRRLADARATGHHRHLGAEHQFQSLALRSRQGLARAALHPGNGLVEVDLRPRRWAGCPLDQPGGNGLLGQMQALEKQTGLVADGVRDDLSFGQAPRRWRCGSGPAPTSSSCSAKRVSASTGKAQ